MKRVFITGSPRSGTSLLARLLGDGPTRRAFSQPLPLLITELRRRFLASLGRDEIFQAYPFADDQFENYAEPEAFAAFLDRAALSVEEIRASLGAMRDYSGQYFKPEVPYASLDDWQEGALAKFAEHYFAVHGAGEQKVWKEVAAESLSAYLASEGWATLLIIRDPRDAIASMLYGTGQEHAGLPRPILFMARQWRRSALYALAAPYGLTAVRYEDVLENAQAELSKFAGDGGVLTDSLSTRHNTSFGSGNERRILEPRVQRFVEAICHAEMTVLGYRPSLAANEIEAVLRDGPGQEALHRPVLERFIWNNARLDEELRRRLDITDPAARFDRKAFLFPRALERLSEACK